MTRTVWETCPPRWATRRTRGRPTYGPRVAKVARRFGWEPMPWQQYVWDVALECDPDTGKLIYRYVIVTVPRQSGKTSAVLPVFTWRETAALMLGGRQFMLYSAQTRQKARQKFEREYVYRLNKARFITQDDEHWTNGDEHVVFPRNGSYLGIESTTEKAGHGDVLDMAAQDEAFSLPDDRMDQSFRPPMLTRFAPQYWILSTMGTDKSVYLNSKVDKGRALVESGVNTGTAYFEWSADPTADPSSPDTWFGCMPALGHTVTVETIQSEFDSDMKLDEFSRAYLNIRSNEVVSAVIPIAWWQACIADATIIGQPVIAFDVAPLSSRSSIAIAGTSSVDPNACHVEIVENEEGSDWLVRRILEIRDRAVSIHHTPVRAIALDDIGPAGRIGSELKRFGVEPLTVGARGMTQACEGLYSAAKDQTFSHLGDPVLTASLRGAGTRQVGDSWAWRRRTSSSDITPLVAATVACWAHGEAPILSDVMPLVSHR